MLIEKEESTKHKMQEKIDVKERTNASLSELDNKILQKIQNDIEIKSNLFSNLANELNLTEDKLIASLIQLKKDGFIKYIRPIFNSKKLGFKSTLVGANVKEKDIESIKNKIDLHPGISHNYLRENEWNMWFTLTIPKDENFEDHIKKLTYDTSIKYIILPSEKTYKIRVYFGKEEKKEGVRSTKAQKETRNKLKLVPYDISNIEKEIIRKIQSGLEITKKPFLKIADKLNIGEDEVIDKIQILQNNGIIKRISGLVKHEKIGYAENAMVVWNVENRDPDNVGNIFLKYNEISHLYLRKTYPNWPHGLYTMIHSKNKEELKDLLEKMSTESKISDYKILKTIKELKKQPTQYF